ncbi:glycosyltransferase family 2 protein [Haloferula chungangensis]|uniref:Glycosyltransferase family 2 protein n=1 Tax=Haloferula chungangensis TaxID=1048331 RepID=A0ABW2LAX1_9BACT
MITTKNRVDDLRETLRHIATLDPPPLEVIITADGCEDRTEEMVRSEMPDALLIVNEVGRGSVASRATMMERAKGDLVLALDDDSYPEQNNCLASLANLFEQKQSLAIATFPQRTDEYPESLEQDDFGKLRPIRTFPNSGACLRVSTYRSLAGFEPMFFHMYEEPDYALQCIANDWEVLFFPEVSIRHHWTPNQRSELRNHHRHARNEFWSTLMRCPFPQALGFIAWRTFAQARFALSRGPSWALREPVWWWQALKGMRQALRRRRPVTWAGYKKWLAMPDG